MLLGNNFNCTEVFQRLMSGQINRAKRALAKGPNYLVFTKQQITFVMNNVSFGERHLISGDRLGDHKTRYNTTFFEMQQVFSKSSLERFNVYTVFTS